MNILACRGVKIGAGVALVLLLAAVGLMLTTDRGESGEGAAPERLTAGEQTEEGESLEEHEPADSLETLQEMDRGSEMTWERLQTLVEQENPQLEDYAGYAGASWPDGSTVSEDPASLTSRLFYFLEDADNEQNYRLDIYYWKEDLTLDSVYLMRESDRDMRMLYRRGFYRNADIAAFRRDIRQLGDWVSSWELPHEKQVRVEAYRADLLMGEGVLFDWKEEPRDMGESWPADEWKSAGGFVRVSRGEEGEPPFVFDDGGHLTNLDFLMNHTSITRDSEALEGCEEQAVLLSMNHDLYTASQLCEMEEAGTPVPEEEATADIWYIAFAREDAPYGYVLFLAERYYTREEAVAMAQSIRFTDAAWAH